MKAKELLEQLKAEVKKQKTAAETLLQEPEDKLNISPAAGKWNALQCIAHLNSYASHYLPEFEKSIEQSRVKGRLFADEVKSTWLGKKCINTVLVTNAKKIKTPARHNHISKTFDKKVIHDFLEHQQKLERILDEAAGVNLGKTKVKIEIFPLLKLHLADFFRFFIYHQTRHLEQAKRCLIVDAR